MMKQTVLISLRNQEEGLVRLIDVFRRRGYRIEKLSMAINQQDDMKIVVTFSCNQFTAHKLLHYVNKLIDVVTVEVVDDRANSAEIYIPVNQSA